MSFFDAPFEGNPSRRSNTVDLSTSTSTSSTALLSSIRLERLARDKQRRQEHAATLIQRMWRGRSEARRMRERLLDELEQGNGGVGKLNMVLGGNATMGLGRATHVDERARRVLVQWVQRVMHNGGLVRVVAQEESWTVKLGQISLHILRAVAVDPTSADAAVLLSALESLFGASAWSVIDPSVADEAKSELVQALARGEWVEQLVVDLEKLIATGLPKKKHPNIAPVIRLLTAPLELVPNPPQSVAAALLHSLLAVPSLPTSIPIPSLTYLSNHLPVFATLLPLGATNRHLLNTGSLVTELGKTHFLANLITFGITGGMLARHGLAGATNWIRVVGTVLGGVREGWGKWVEGHVEEPIVEPMAMNVDVDTEADPDSETPAAVLGPSAPRPNAKARRTPIPGNTQKKVVQLASAAHLTALSDTLLAPTAPAPLLNDFARFALALLNAFRGSPKWEGILDTFIGGTKGKALEKRIWREGVRGKWRSDRSSWDTFAENPSTPCLLFLTHLYNHYLLVTPDDEFFDTQKSNPFSLDEVLELAGIWRDLSYHAFSNGVQPGSGGSSKGPGSEDERALLTRGVVRVAERNARRKFADDDFWVMVPQNDLKGFVEAAVYEDAELANSQDAELDARTDLPRWARQRQRYSKRQMAYISPRLGLLNNLPMAVPFTTRLKIFRNFIWKDKERSGVYGAGRIKAKIRRDRLAQDGFDQLADVGVALKGDVFIKFYDQWGNRESGIDGGGLFKEFLTSLSKEVFDTNRGLWLMTDDNQLYPNPHSYATEAHQLRWYAFIGRVLGKALYEGILVDVSFADFFLAKWLGRQSYLDDLASLDRELYKGLIILKNYPKPEELALNFTITNEEFGETKTIDLVPNGADIPVTAYNKNEYIQLVCRHKLDRQISAQSRAFFSGLSDIIDSKWLRMFDQRELRQLIGGEETIIDMDDLKAHCEVTGFPNDETMRMFWRVVKAFNQEERRALLRFVTSCSRPPLLGFAYLNPRFGVRFSGTDTTRLPSASACFNLLKLPGYQDEQSMRAKLLQAITSGAGFDLS